MFDMQGMLSAVVRVVAFIVFIVLFAYLAAGFVVLLLLLLGIGAVYAFFRRGKRKEGDGFVFYVHRSEWGSPPRENEGTEPDEQGMPRVLGSNQRRERDDDVIDV